MEPFTRAAPGREIGEYVCAPKPVDGLLRVAHHDERSRAQAPATYGRACAATLDPLARVRRIHAARPILPRSVRSGAPPCRAREPVRHRPGGIGRLGPLRSRCIGRPGPALAVDPAEDPRLDRIGVLVLIDEGTRICVADPLREAPPPHIPERIVELDQQVVVGEAPVVTDVAADRHTDLGQNLPAGPPEPLVAGGAQRPGGFLQAIERIEQRVVRQCEVFPACLRERLPAVTAKLALLRQPGIGGGQQGLDLGQLPRGSGPLVTRSVEPGSLQHLDLKVAPAFIPFGPHRFEHLAPRGFPHLDRLRKGVAAHHGASDLRTPSRHPRTKLGRQETVLHRVARHEHGCRIQAPAPEVPHRAGHDLDIAAAHLEIEREIALEREIGQHPLAESVDGVHVRPVDVAHRGFEAPCQRAVDLPSLALPCFEQLTRLGVDFVPARTRGERGFGRPPCFDCEHGGGSLPGFRFRRLSPDSRPLSPDSRRPSPDSRPLSPGFRCRRPAVSCGVARPHRIQHCSKEASGPVPELRGGGSGEGHDENLVELPAFLDDEAGYEGGEGAGLPGTRARFDEHRSAAVEREIERRPAGAGGAGFGGGTHRCAPASGTRSSAARFSKSSASGSSPSWIRLR